MLSIIAAVGFGLATLLVDTVLGRSRSFHHYSVVIAAGILLAVALADLVPEALELTDGIDAPLAVAAGFLLLFVVESLTGAHTHHHEPHDHAHGHSHAHSHAPAPTPTPDPSCVPTHAVVPFLIGLGIHNLADGLVIGATHEVSDTAAAGVAAGILVHQLPVGISFAAVLMASGLGRSRVRRDAALIASLIPVGTLVVLLAPNPSDSALGILLGVAAGALLYIATGHLLPEAQSEERRPGIAGAFSIALICTMLLLGAAHGEDAHGSSHDAPTVDDHAGSAAS